MKRVKKILMAWLACLTIGVSTVGMTSCNEVVEMLKEGLNIFITTNKDGISGDEGTPNNQPPVKTPSVGLNIILDLQEPSSYDPETGEITHGDSYYTIEGMGTCTDTDLVIPAEYNAGKVHRMHLAGAGMEAFVRAYGERQGMSEAEIEETISRLAMGVTNVAVQRIWFTTTMEEISIIGMNSLTEIVLEKGVEHFFVIGCTKFKTLYYMGTAEDWKAVDKGDTDFFTATVYFYSESAPTTSGYYWHYVDGEPTAW